ncbi:MAG TPA: glycoside hydrolase family 15 protein [Candidatus Binatia bacterium]|nr:glycoside hydrolase family 15 protein [Candidatus Binatia bacterium]
MDAPRTIGDYAVVGNCRTAALVSRTGAVDWLCLPRFDGPAVFAALLDRERGGRLAITPRGEARVERRYEPDTNVLETVFRVPGGACVLRDAMPVESEEAKRRFLVPEHELLREIEGLEGEVALDVVFEPRPDYGAGGAVLTEHGALGLHAEVGHGELVLRTDVPLRRAPDGASAAGVCRVRAGERRHVSLSFASEAPSVVPPLGEAARERLATTAAWWRAWAGRCAYGGPYRAAVARSALALKLMTYAPSGAVVAAPTTSLPEWPGGVRNWDYRYCWLRDASITVRALFALGYAAEAEAFLQWMLHATRLTWPALQVVYDVFGGARLSERTLEHLAGFAGSRPVRVGNGAHAQLQLDVYGEVVDAAAQFAGRDGRFDRDTQQFLVGLGRTVCERWREPDEGIWEVRAGRFQHTHSKVLCWVALDRLLGMHARRWLAVPVDRFHTVAAAIRTVIETEGWSARAGSYVARFGSDAVDASLLVLPLYGYVDARAPRMRATWTRVLGSLGRGDALVQRYAPEGLDDGLPAGEGCFGLASFWAVECLARAGEVEHARRRFERLLGYANDVGLYAEEIDPATGAALGNFPQAFTHVGLISAALALAEARGEDALDRARAPRPGVAV